MLKWKRGKKMNDFKKFIEYQNAVYFNPLKVTIEYEPIDAEWIKFSLMDDEKMYEEEIAHRKHHLIKHPGETDAEKERSA